ncbi:hypothetical protein ACH5RR_036396 [Cinchona calisaya]|uniref:PTM/DIR17-like Tudor domain-containing protein n=1 Tax=Cinchona calisaya TaxID=153742 RepID=A0ABD2Y7U4_9GENT
MDSTNKVNATESLPTGIYELPGESAILINGLPDKHPTEGALVACDVFEDVRLRSDPLLAEWFIGRIVRKSFGEKFYSGKVTDFDQEIEKYKVAYENGDIEDLEMHELEAVLEPLDIKVPLEEMAKRIIKRQKKFDNSKAN